MTDRRRRDLKRALLALAAPYGADVMIENTKGSHIRAVLCAGAVAVSIVTSNSHSDWRTQRNLEARVRRKLRSIVPTVSA